MLQLRRRYSRQQLTTAHTHTYTDDTSSTLRLGNGNRSGLGGCLVCRRGRWRLSHITAQRGSTIRIRQKVQEHFTAGAGGMAASGGGGGGVVLGSGLGDSRGGGGVGTLGGPGVPLPACKGGGSISTRCYTQMHDIRSKLRTWRCRCWRIGSCEHTHRHETTNNGAEENKPGTVPLHTWGRERHCVRGRGRDV